MILLQLHTVLVEIIRDSKNIYFFRDHELLWSKFQDRELLGSRIIRRVRICIYVRASPHVHSYSSTRTHTHTHVYIGVNEMAAAAICIESDDDVEPEVENEKTRQLSRSLLHCLPDKFCQLGHGPRCDSDGLGPERRPNGP